MKTNRDAWCYNFSHTKLIENIETTTDFYNSVAIKARESIQAKETPKILQDLTKISWSWNLRKKALKGTVVNFDKSKIQVVSHRPFTKQWTYYDSVMIENRYLLTSLFPKGSEDNIAIHVSGKGARSGFSVLMVKNIIDAHHQDNGQLFPLKLYINKEISKSKQEALFDAVSNEQSIEAQDGISDHAHKFFNEFYVSNEINKIDIFFYVYGLLHSEQYRTEFSDNLAKELPRIPCVKNIEDFWKFSSAGKKLSDIHLNYENQPIYPVNILIAKNGSNLLVDDDYKVKQMKYLRRGDKTSVVYNSMITITNIPEDAYEYIVNGRPALECVMDRQSLDYDKGSMITNDPNDWANETIKNPKYILELFQRMITVSLETMKIVKALPKLDI
jgi:predicted helicase